MARRILLAALFFTLLYAEDGAQAQVWTPQSNLAGPMPALFSSKRSAYPNRTQYGGPTDAAVPLNYATPRTAVPGVPYMAMRGPVSGYQDGCQTGCPPQYAGGDDIVTTRVPPQPDWSEPTPFEATISQIITRSWYRLEWLSWTIDDPGVITPPLPLIDTVNFEFRDNNGLRGTIGVPLRGATLEWETLVLAQSSDQQRIRSTALTPLNSVLWTGDFWGSQLNLVLDPENPHPGFQFSPMFGFRYLNLRETMELSAPFLVTGAIRTDSNVQNNHYGPQIGLRSEFVAPRWKLGADVKMALAYNTYKAQLQTPSSFIDENGTKFAPVGELGVYANVQLNETFSVWVKGNWLWLDSVSRPDKNVRYVGTQPRLNALFNDLQIYGISVGGQITLP